jgi:hypothetical protein
LPHPRGSKREELRTTLLARHSDIEIDVIAADLSVPVISGLANAALAQISQRIMQSS